VVNYMSAQFINMDEDNPTISRHICEFKPAPSFDKLENGLIITISNRDVSHAPIADCAGKEPYPTRRKIKDINGWMWVREQPEQVPVQSIVGSKRDTTDHCSSRNSTHRSQLRSRRKGCPAGHTCA
jgi:hypothetical protein